MDLLKNATELLEEARKHRSEATLIDTRRSLLEAERLVEEARSISNRINFKEAEDKINEFLNNLQKERKALEKIIEGETGVLQPDYEVGELVDFLPSKIEIKRETEFYNGFIRLKISLTNTSSLTLHDTRI